MGEWLTLPQAERIIARHVSPKFQGGRKVRRRSDRVVNYDPNDVANLDDLVGMDVPLWECEISQTDDGF